MTKAMTLVTGGTIALPRSLSWVKKGGFTLLDHGLFSGANFLVNILLSGSTEFLGWGWPLGSLVANPPLLIPRCPDWV